MKQQFHQLIHQARLKNRNSQDTQNLRNYTNQSYQQYEFLNMKSSFEKLIQTLEYLAKLENVNHKCFINILQNPHKFSSSLMSLSRNISTLLEEQSHIRISHQHHSSQIIFLALFLRFTHPDKHISILSSKKSYKNWQKYLLDLAKSTDPQSDLKNLLSEAKINIHFISEAHTNQIIHSNQILIFDFFNLQAIDYKPLLLANRDRLAVPEKIIIYHSHDQENDVQVVLNSISVQFFQCEASLTYPIEIQLTQKDQDIKKNLCSFLNEDSTHPQKQDLIIFYKNQHLSNSTAKRFSAKLKQAFSDQNLNNNVQLIISKNQILAQGKNHIFIVQNVDQLIEWNYSYSNVFYIIDYGWNAGYQYDHESNCWIELLAKSDLRQKTRRLSFVGINKVGKYIYKQTDYSAVKSYLQRAPQLMSYTLKMINLQLTQFLELQNPIIKKCVASLISNKIIKKQQNGILTISDEQILKYHEQGVNPLQANMIKKCLEKQKQKEQKDLTNLMLMALCILNTRGNLRQSKDTIGQKTTIKPTGIWRKTGYLDSCLEILTKAEIVEAGKNATKSLSQRKTSKINQPQYEAFGNMFETIIPKKMEFQQMKMEDLLREYFVNDIIFAQIRDKIDQLREIFGVQQTNIKLDNHLLNEVIQIIANTLTNSTAVFSGSRRLGYLFKHQLNKKNSIFPNRDSLISQLNQTPQFLLVLRCTEQQEKRQILMCNLIHLDSFMSVFGQLPSKKSDSLAEHEIQFHGISSSIFKGLLRNKGLQMAKFQQQNKCFVEPNEQMATITIYCGKENSHKIKSAFDDLISKIKQKFVNYNKIVHYIGNTNLSMSNGGQIKQIIKDNYINSCSLNNLDLEVTQQDLQELFDEFFVLKSIDVLPAQTGKFSKSAVIQFNSQKDYYRFYSYYNQCKYFDRLLEVKPITMKKTFTVEEQKYINFKWYVWKSHRKAIVTFKSPLSAQKAELTLKQNPNIDESPVTFSVDKKRIHLDNLNQAIDEIFLKMHFSAFGDIQDVEILKTPLKQPNNQATLLDCIIRDALGIQRNENIEDKYKINQMQKHKNGLRTCKVSVKKDQHMNALLDKLRNVKGMLGEGRLYSSSVFTKPILIIYPSAINLYQQLLEETINSAEHKNIQYFIKDYGPNRLYLMLKSFMKGTLDYISNQFQKKLSPYGIQLSQMQKNIILSDVGINNLIDIQEKFNCKLVVNSMKKSLEVICKFNDLKRIKEQVTARVQDKFFYRISLNSKAYKNISDDKAKLEQIKNKYFLNVLQIQQYSKTLIFQGSANHVQNALNNMMFVIQSYVKAQEELINTEVCLICYEELFRPYRLQNCGHKFCFGCLDQCINSALGDITMFPIKCPHCVVQLTIDDLESLLDSTSWPKIINMAANQYVNRNADIMTFCYTAGCKQINMLKLGNFKCDMCAVSYCCQCKQRWHEGLTCQQAKIGGDALFKKYMQQNGVRICPNKNCKMPIQRTDGCYRVTCSRCNKSMCFKCDPEKMIAYDDYNECYKHLNDAHGGYW